MSRQDHPSHLAHMEFNLVTRVISASLEQSSASDSLPRRRAAAGMGSFKYRFYAENSDFYNGGQPCVRKSWAAIGDRERA